MSLQLHRPDGKGGLEPRPETQPDYRTELRSPRWGSRTGRSKLPSLSNPEMRPTPVLLSVLFWVGLAFATFVILVAGYGLGVWHFAG